eukprot:2621801-Alexandrium_andersonii.AAC.1
MQMQILDMRYLDQLVSSRLLAARRPAAAAAARAESGPARSSASAASASAAASSSSAAALPARALRRPLLGTSGTSRDTQPQLQSSAPPPRGLLGHLRHLQPPAQICSRPTPFQSLQGFQIQSQSFQPSSL